MDGPGSLISLKVMRLSRPTIAKAWEPFYSSSPSFSANSTASILSLQGKTPLPGHPKTLRDLTHATELLTLPSAFGTIQLGETFTCCLCVNNEANLDIDGVGIKVEMQTATSKIVLFEFGGPDCSLLAGDTKESVVSHEIKELGQHVLGCTVSYRLPPHIRGTASADEIAPNPDFHTFRKFYKFAVINPLSVKTKVHTPRSPSALFSTMEKHKVFLEVHIQNLTPDAMWFERMQFLCAEDWKVEDSNMLYAGENGEKDTIFSGSMSLMQPQDIRQYIYILQPVSVPSSPITHEPGTIIPLGRLDLSWRSAFGEPGRLLTSMLSRRIPFPPVTQQPASALPPHLKRTPTPSNAASRPHSPQANSGRPGTPPPIPRPGSPFRTRPIGPARPQSPVLQSPVPRAATTQTPLVIPLEASDVQVDLIVRNVPRESIATDKPFTIACTLIASASPPPPRPPDGFRQQRLLSLVVQHVQTAKSVNDSANLALIPEPLSPRYLHSSVTSPPAIDSVREGFPHVLPHQRVLVVSPKQENEDQGPSADGPILPAPFALPLSEHSATSSPGAIFLGSSAIFLDRIILPESASGSNNKVRVEREFELSYLPLRKGFLTLGGLRAILVEDRMVAVDDDGSLQDKDNRNDQVARPTLEAKVLDEWDVVAEVWVHSS